MTSKKPLKLLLVDNQSKFIFYIIKALKKRNVNFKRINAMRSNAKKIEAGKFDGVILSGGPNEHWKRRSSFNGKIIEKFKTKPLLGICLGHEFLIEHYGGKIGEMEDKIKRIVQIKILRKNKLSGNRKQLCVYEAHRNIILSLPKTIKSLASSKLCKFEIVEHKKRPHFGVQFHPERSGKDGGLIFDNFLKICECQR